MKNLTELLLLKKKYIKIIKNIYLCLLYSTSLFIKEWVKNSTSSWILILALISFFIGKLSR